MSKFRQGDAGIDIRTFGLTLNATLPQPILAPRHADWHQLLHVSRGAMTVRAGRNQWLVIPHRAVWIPAGVEFGIRLGHGEVALRSLYLRSTRAYRGPSAECVALNVTPLLAELILRAVSLGALARAVPAERRLTAVIRDELDRLAVEPLKLPIPSDTRAARLAALVQTDQARPALSELLRQCGASRRTIERLFREQTAMSLGRWIRRHDLLSAVECLASGATVAEVAERLSYGSPSAFIAMFKRELGHPPAAYLKLQAAGT